MAAKTAEQMNAERRAAKARQNAVAKAKAQSKGTNNGQFDLQAALKAQRSRQRFIEQREQERQDNLNRFADSRVRQLQQAGAVRCSVSEFDKRSEFIEYVYAIVAYVRSNPKYTYNRDWKETGEFVAAVKR